MLILLLSVEKIKLSRADGWCLASVCWRDGSGGWSGISGALHQITHFLFHVKMLSTSAETCSAVTSGPHLRGFWPMCSQLGQVWEWERWNGSADLRCLPPFGLSAPLLDRSPGERAVGGEKGGQGASYKWEADRERNCGALVTLCPWKLSEPAVFVQSVIAGAAEFHQS